jgi:hypothetical protein
VQGTAFERRRPAAAEILSPRMARAQPRPVRECRPVVALCGDLIRIKSPRS